MAGLDLDLIVVPYDSGHRAARMGAGPLALVHAQLEGALSARGHRVRTVEIEASSWRAEIGTAFELAAAIASAVRDARAAGRFPVVLAGNCGASIGVVAGVGEECRVVWLDAHADFNTPETTTSGFLDGMSLAVLAGRCWTALAARVNGFAAVADERIWLLGARDLDPAEVEALDGSRVHRVSAAEIGEDAAATIAKATPPGTPLYLHVDLDVVDPADGRANHYATAEGVRAAPLVAFCGRLASDHPPAALTLSAYDPAVDASGRVRAIAFDIVAVVVDGLQG